MSPSTKTVDVSEGTNILTVDAYVPINDVYQSWCQSRTSRISSLLDDETDSEPRPAKRSKFQPASEVIGQATSSTTISPARPATRKVSHGHPSGQQLLRRSCSQAPFSLRQTHVDNDHMGSDYERGPTGRDSGRVEHRRYPPSIPDSVIGSNTD